MRVATASFALVLSSVWLQGASILSTVCRLDSVAGGTVMVTSTAACRLDGPPVEPYTTTPFAEAQAFADYGLLEGEWSETIPAGAFRASTGVNTAAGQPHDNAYSEAQARVELFLRATTSGPLRPGFVDLDFVPYIDSIGSFTVLSAAIGPLFAEREGWAGNCQGACGGSFAFVLGQPFDIRVVASSESRASPEDSFTYGNGHAAVVFQLRELDGSPVVLAFDSGAPTIPEPSALILLGTGLLLLLRSVAGRRRCSQ
jgi:hypothetical protein